MAAFPPGRTRPIRTHVHRRTRFTKLFFFNLAIVPQHETMAQVIYRRGFKYIETWKICGQCFHEFFPRYNQCPLCKATVWKIGKKMLTQWQVIEDGVDQRSMILIFQSDHCDVRLAKKQNQLTAPYIQLLCIHQHH